MCGPPSDDLNLWRDRFMTVLDEILEEKRRRRWRRRLTIAGLIFVACLFWGVAYLWAL